MSICSWLNFGSLAPPERGSAVGWIFLTLPFYSQCAVFASPLSAFFHLDFGNMDFVELSYVSRDYSMLGWVLHGSSKEPLEIACARFFTDWMCFLSLNLQYWWKVSAILPRESKKKQDTLLMPITYQMSADFQNSFTCRLSSNCEMKRSSKIPPQLKCFATLPCEM